MAREINDAGFQEIKGYEGLRLHAYRDGAGIWTIGYGHTGPDVRAGESISNAQADELLRADLATAEDAVAEIITVELSDNQFAALVSFTFNVGAGTLRQSTLRRRLNAGDYDCVPAELNKYVYDHRHHREPGLVSRRASEANLWTQDDQEASANAPANPPGLTLASFATPEHLSLAMSAAAPVGAAALHPGAIQIAACVIAVIFAGFAAAFLWKRMN